jgi:uncharacterized protein YcgI (DUF1989 family)
MGVPRWRREDDVDLIDSIEIAAYSGGWVRAQAGDLVRIVDVEGSQIADMFAVTADDLTEWLSAANTRGAIARLFPRVGEAFHTTRYRPILELVADDSPGVHDMLWRACDPYLYASRGVVGDHANCSDNFRAAAAEFGWHPEVVPDPVDFFQNTPLDEHHQLGVGPGPTGPGDSVTLRALMDTFVVVTSCSFDLPGSRINGDRCTPIRVEVTRG